jgi:mono/diheme cytochrome c family protein
MCISRSAFTFAIALALFGQAHANQAGSDAATREDFLGLCADCHGADARGNGPLAKNLSKVPPDLTRIQERANGKFNEKAVFDWIIGLDTPNFHGTREMPIWGDWLMDETLEGGTSLEAAHAAEKEIERRVMALVKYLEAMQVGR